MRFRGKKNVGAEPRLEPASPATAASRKKNRHHRRLGKVGVSAKSALPAEDGGGKNRRRRRGRWREEKPGMREIHLSLKSVA